MYVVDVHYHTKAQHVLLKASNGQSIILRKLCIVFCILNLLLLDLFAFGPLDFVLAIRNGRLAQHH